MRPPSSLDTFWRLAVGITLIPWTVGAAWALLGVLRATGSAADFWVPVLGGVASWVTIFLLLPKPLWLYVVGHELTHALWAWLFGGRVKAFRADAQGGHVVVTRSNTLIVLAPYFFPLYAVLWVLLWWTLSWFVATAPALPWFHLGLGLTYAFHVTLTVHVLRVRQPDIAAEGWFLSGVVMALGNILVLLMALPPLTDRVSLWTACVWTFERTGRFLTWVTSPLG